MDFSFSQIFSSAWGMAMVILFFGGSIFVHELGHFLAAIWRGLKVERFSIGFGPRLFGWTRNGIDYRVSLFPLGGYVALPQLADMRGIEGEGADATQLPPITYTDKVIVASAGAVFNIIFAFLIATVLWQVKVPTNEQNTNAIVGHVSDTAETADGIVVVSPAKQAGIQIGDRIAVIDGHTINNFMDLQQYVAIGRRVDENGRRVADITIERDGEMIDLTLNPIISKHTNRRLLGIQSSYTMNIHSVVPDSPAALAGIKANDILVAINGVKLYGASQYMDILKANKGEAINLSLLRKDEAGNESGVTVSTIPQSIPIDTQGNEEVLIGLQGFYGKESFIKQNPFSLIGDTVVKTYTNLRSLVSTKSDIKLTDMSGPVGIANMIYETSKIDIRIMLWVIVMINVGLAIFNMLPIPVLDGGHIVFATIAKIQNKPLPINFIATIQGSFMVLLLGMICYISFFDVTRLREGSKAEEEYKAEVNKRIPWVFEDAEKPAE